jgi:hypothetical protein
MADLLDIAPSTAVEAVKLTDGRWLKVRGLHGNAIASIMGRFPSLMGLLVGGTDDIVPRLVSQFGIAIAPIIAAGCGHLEDEKGEQIAGTLPLQDQIKLLSAIYRLTFPEGLSPLVDAMTSLMGGPAERKPVRLRLKTSPSASPLSSDVASLPTMQ